MSEFKNTITFEYVKTNLFRSIYADGAFVGGRPNGLSITFFSDRQPIPQLVVNEINQNGTLGNEIVEKRVVKSSIIRDTEVTIGMSLETARNVIATLQEVIHKLETAQSNPGGG